MQIVGRYPGLVKIKSTRLRANDKNSPGIISGHYIGRGPKNNALTPMPGTVGRQQTTTKKNKEIKVHKLTKIHKKTSANRPKNEKKTLK